MSTFAAQNETTLLASSYQQSYYAGDPASEDEAPACVVSGTRLRLKATAEEEEARQKAPAPERKEDEDFVDEQKRTWAQVMEALEYMGIPLPRRTHGSPIRQIGNGILIAAIVWYDEVQLRIHPDKIKSSPLVSEVSDEQRSRVVEAGDTFKHAIQHGWWANDRDCGRLAVVARNRVPWKPLNGMMPPRPDFVEEIRDMLSASSLSSAGGKAPKISQELRDPASEDDAPACVLSGASRKRARQAVDPAPPNVAPQRDEHVVKQTKRIAKCRRAYIKKTNRIAKQLEFRRRNIAYWEQGAADKEACQKNSDREEESIIDGGPRSATAAVPRPWPTPVELNKRKKNTITEATS